MTDTISDLAQKLRPHWLRDLGASVSSSVGGGGGSGMIVHALYGAYHTGELDPSQAPWALTSLRNMIAGAGLTGGGDLTADRTFNVGAGTLITVGADDVSITDGANYQFIGTSFGTDASWINLSTLAGNGLNYGSGVMGVGVSGLGLSLAPDAVILTSSNSPGVAASILASGTNGELTLQNGFFTQGAQSTAVFASGFAGSGWRTDYGITRVGKASMEVDDLTVRGRMRVYELLIQQIRATNGSVFVSSASKVVEINASATNPLWTVNGAQLTFNGANATLTGSFYTISTAKTSGATDTDGGVNDRRNYHGFLYGDITRAQQTRWNGSSFAGIIQSDLEVTSVTNLHTYGAALVSGDVPAVGYDYVRLGSTTDNSRQGAIYLTSDDSAAPFIDIVDGIASHDDWNSAGVHRVRVGKLSGISDVAFGGSLSGYGLYGDNVYLKGQIVITGGELGGLAASDVNDNITTISGGKITANSITAAQIQAGSITTTELNFVPVASTNVVASINASAEGIRIAGNRITIDGTVTFTSGYDPTTKLKTDLTNAPSTILNSSVTVVTLGAIASGNAATDINTNVTLINGGKITTGSIIATQLSVTTLSAITANMGTLTLGSIVIGSTQKLWLNDSSDGALNIGGTVKASAPFRVTSTGALTATSATVTGALIATSGGISGNFYVGSDVGATGNFYVGTNGDVRFSADGIRLLLPLDTSPNIPSATQAIRWFPSGTGTWSSAISYAGLITYKNTSTTPDVQDLNLTCVVGDNDDLNLSARVVLQAGHYAGGVYTDANLVITREPTGGGRFVDVACDTCYFSDGVYVTNNMSALTITDRTPHFDGDALGELLAVKGKPKRGSQQETEIDHSTLPSFARKQVMNRHTKEVHDERDIGAMISMLTVAVQQLNERLEAVEGVKHGNK